ncbi:hypothetical protein PMZ80_008968 [Knufia obscura]|nr:hypothetical protein PMZ80_008968 [Knufia obscura]
MNSDSFRFNDLPDELQILIYLKYFEDTKLTLPEGWCKKSDSVVGMPSLNLELVCHKMRIESRKARSEQTCRILSIPDSTAFVKGLRYFAKNDKFKWLRNHIEELRCVGSWTPATATTSWPILVFKCPRLRRVDLTADPYVCEMPLRNPSDAYCLHDFAQVKVKIFFKAYLETCLGLRRPSVRKAAVRQFRGWALCDALQLRHGSEAIASITSNTTYHGSDHTVFFHCKRTNLYRGGKTLIKNVVTSPSAVVRSWIAEMHASGEMEAMYKRLREDATLEVETEVLSDWWDAASYAELVRYTGQADTT